jgi:hypothetical protein
MRDRIPTYCRLSRLACLGLLFALVIGCRTPQPKLTPPKQPDQLNVPPDDPRYQTSAWPAKIMERDENKKTKSDDAFAGMPGKTPGSSSGSMMPSGMGNGMGSPSGNPRGY